MADVKIKLQIDTEKANIFISELANLANKYGIEANIDKSIISFDVADLLEIREIYRAKESYQELFEKHEKLCEQELEVKEYGKENIISKNQKS